LANLPGVRGIAGTEINHTTSPFCLGLQISNSEEFAEFDCRTEKDKGAMGVNDESPGLL